MIFWRILDNQLHPLHQTDNLGFEESEGLRIPDLYLYQNKFMVMRTAHGIGDWGIISAMPRLLKEKYPNCKVVVPSKKLLKKLFGVEHNNVHVVFDNNPFVDEFVDEINGEVFHDHYRIYDKNNTDIPLIKQMLKFWQFNDNEMEDYLPEMYWSPEEETLGNAIIKDRTKGEDYGCLLVSERFGTLLGKHHQEGYDRDEKNITKLLEENKLPFFYWSHKPIRKYGFEFDKVLDLRNIDLRIQLYIKSKAKINISNQCGTSQIVVRYSKCYTSQRQWPLAHNILHGEVYL